MKPQRAALVLSSIVTFCAQNAWSMPAATGSMAKVTAAHGDVFKRDFVDWTKETWGDPIPAEVNDPLREGMQLGTGNKSWVEVCWPSVKTRAWSNTVFAIAPNKRLVYLLGGEMLLRLDKNRKDKQDYVIWTKVLQARVRGTTVFIQQEKNLSRITVLEGSLDVLNRLDKSRVHLQPGVVYEIKCHHSLNNAPLSQRNVPASSANAADVCLDSTKPVPLFDNSKATSNIYVANSSALLQHDLVARCGAPIDSLPLIQKCLAKVPGFIAPMASLTASSGKMDTKLDRIILQNVQILGVPTNVNYLIGQAVGSQIPLSPAAMLDCLPQGIVGELPRLPPTTAHVSRPPALFMPTPFHLFDSIEQPQAVLDFHMPDNSQALLTAKQKVHNVFNYQTLPSAFTTANLQSIPLATATTHPTSYMINIHSVNSIGSINTKGEIIRTMPADLAKNAQIPKHH